MAEANDRQELLRLLGSIQMEKGIDREMLIDSLEAALVASARKKHPEIEELRIRINADTGEIMMFDGDRPVRALDPASFGRIAAQTTKQIFIQRLREAENEVVFGDYSAKEGTIITGIVNRVDRNMVVLNIGKADGVIPRAEQMPAENYRPGDRVRCYVTNVRKKGNKVQITLSRTHPSLVREMFEIEVPEIYEHVVEIKGLVREPGYRTKLAVACSDSRVDPVGACVGMRGARIRNIVEELGGEKIDIVRWNENPDMFIRNALSPAEVQSIEFDRRRNRARVIVTDDQLSLAIGRKGQNVRLSSKLTGWNLDIMTIDQHSEWRALGREEIASIPGVGDETANNLLLTGFECFQDIIELGVGELMKVKGIAATKADDIYQFALDGYQKRLAADKLRRANAAAVKKEKAAAGFKSEVNNLDPEDVEEVTDAEEAAEAKDAGAAPENPAEAPAE